MGGDEDEGEGALVNRTLARQFQQPPTPQCPPLLLQTTLRLRSRVHRSEEEAVVVVEEAGEREEKLESVRQDAAQAQDQQSQARLRHALCPRQKSRHHRCHSQSTRHRLWQHWLAKQRAARL